MKHPIQDMSRRAFTLVETLLMLCALAVFSLTTLAVLKKDNYSAKAILSKLKEQNIKPSDTVIPPVASPPPAPAPKTAAKTKADGPLSVPFSPLPLPPVPAPASPEPDLAPVQKSAPAGSPAPQPDTDSKPVPGTAE